MSGFAGLHGNLALLVICGLLLAEETGIPLPFVPGDLLLVAAGVLIAAGAVSPLVFVPLAILSAATGATLGYSWAALLGEPGLRALAARLHAAHHLDRAAARLRRSGPLGIAVCRLIPGLRVNTTLMAGALGIDRRTFLLGAFPAICLWVLLFTALGVVAGIPVEHLLARFDRLALRGALLVVIGLGGYLLGRYVPARRGEETVEGHRPLWMLVLAVAIDLGTVASLVAGLDILARLVFHLGGIDDWEDVVTDLSITMLAYIALLRGLTGITAGEALFGVHYRASRSAPGVDVSTK